MEFVFVLLFGYYLSVISSFIFTVSARVANGSNLVSNCFFYLTIESIASVCLSVCQPYLNLILKLIHGAIGPHSYRDW